MRPAPIGPCLLGLTFLAAATGCIADSVQVRAVSPYNLTQGISGVQVRANEGAWVTTDAEGYATLEDVSTPFDLDVDQFTRYPLPTLYPEFPDLTERLYGDLWRLIDLEDDEVVVEVDEYKTGDEPSCRLSGQVAMPEGEQVGLEVSHLKFGEGRQVMSESSFDWDLRHQLNTGTIGVYAVAYQPSEAGGFFAGVSGAGKLDVELPNGGCGEVTNLQVPLSPVTTRRVQLRYRAPTDLDLVSVNASAELRFDDHPASSLSLGSDSAEALSGTFEPLVVSDFGTAWVGVAAWSPRRVVDGDSTRNQRWLYLDAPGAYVYAGAPVPEGASVVELELSPPVQLLEPEEGASFDATTRFSWEAQPETEVYGFSMACRLLGAPSGNVQLHRLETRSTELQIPAFMLDAVESGMSCIWSVSVSREAADGRRTSAWSADRFVRAR